MWCVEYGCVTDEGRAKKRKREWECNRQSKQYYWWKRSKESPVHLLFIEVGERAFRVCWRDSLQTQTTAGPCSDWPSVRIRVNNFHLLQSDVLEKGLGLGLACRVKLQNTLWISKETALSCYCKIFMDAVQEWLHMVVMKSLFINGDVTLVQTLGNKVSVSLKLINSARKSSRWSQKSTAVSWLSCE